MKQELVVAERKASEGASKVRSEMMLTVVESEERYRSQIDALKEELNNDAADAPQVALRPVLCVP